MKAQFEKALRDARITAWIAEGDELAVYGMLPFLEKKKVKVAHDLSVACFENTIITFHNSLTTADFRIFHSVFRTLDFILRGVRPNRRNRTESQLTDIEPVVLARRSTGEARKKP